MKQEYKDWILKHYPTKESAKNMCNVAAHAMVAAFPGQLTFKCGTFEVLGFPNHCWTVDKGGNIIDPTAHQFFGEPGADLGTDMYVEFTDPRGFPTGKCMNCGEYAFNNEVACSSRCAHELEEYYGWNKRS